MMPQAELLLSLIQSDAAQVFADNTVGWDRTSQVCDWYGILCDRDDRVTSLSLTGVELGATLPTTLGLLSTLEQLVLANVKLYGTIPTELTELSGLRQIDLSFNALTGSLPVFTAQTLALQSFAHNELSGTISKRIGLGMDKLITLDLRFNYFTGTIPDFESTLLSRLRTIDLSYNELSGNIPVSFTEFPDLKRLYLNNNALHGDIPSRLARADSKMTELHLQSNWLSGTIPSSLATLKDLRELFVDDNLLTGRVPIELCEMNLNDVYFNDIAFETKSGNVEESDRNEGDQSISPAGGARNRMLQSDMPVRDGCSSIACPAGSKSINPDISGVFPCWPCERHDPVKSYLGAHECYQLSEESILRTIYDATNGDSWFPQIRSSWQDKNIEICDRKGVSCDDTGGVSKLVLENTNLVGQLPSIIGSLSKLTQLDLSDNLISGTIPEALSLLEELEKIDLSNNKFVGRVPKSLCSKKVNGNGLDGIFSCDVIACPLYTYNPKGYADPGMDGDHCMPCGSSSAAGLGRTTCLETPPSVKPTVVEETPQEVDEMVWLDAVLIVLLVLGVIGILIVVWKRSSWFRSLIQSRYSSATPQNNKDEAVVEPQDHRFTVSDEGLTFSPPIRNEWVSERVDTKKLWLETTAPQIV